MKIKTGLLLALAIILGACSQPSADRELMKKDALLANQRPLKGVSISPKSYSQDDFLSFMAMVDETQDMLTWAGDWQLLDLDGESPPKTIMELSNEFAYVPVVLAGHYIQSSGELFRPFDDATQEVYEDLALRFVETYKPAYFGMGVEINIFAEKNPAEFERFVPFYNDLYASIKEISPATQVFTVYQLEAMKGLAMWGIEAYTPQWEMLDLFAVDLAVFTTYPGLFYIDPAEMPEDHYTEILEHTTRPVAFAEIGWHSAPSPQGWESSEAEQAQFLEKFFTLTDGLEIDFLVWSFLFDPASIEPFDSMGLFRADGSARPAWGVWMAER